MQPNRSTAWVYAAFRPAGRYLLPVLAAVPLFALPAGQAGASALRAADPAGCQHSNDGRFAHFKCTKPGTYKYWVDCQSVVWGKITYSVHGTKTLRAPAKPGGGQPKPLTWTVSCGRTWEAHNAEVWK